MKRFTKKAQVMQNLGALGIGIAALTILLAVTFLVMAQLRTQTIDIGAACANSTLVYNSSNNYCCDIINCTGAYNYNDTTPGALSNSINSTDELRIATSTIPAWVPLIILVIIGGLILTLVSAFKNR